MKRIFTVQDVSCLGRCSLTVALPIVSAFGVETVILPTAVLSTHTMFKDFTVKDLDDQILPIAEHWKKENVSFDGIYTGYLASAEQIDKVIAAIDMFRTENTLVAVDPAMADNGKLYPAFSKEFPAQMARLCAVADVILPNITEACLLTGREYREQYNEAFVKDIVYDLAKLGAKSVVLTGITYGGRYGVLSYDSGMNYFEFFEQEKLPVSYHGTGDVFSSCFVGALMNGKDMAQAVEIAATFTAKCIEVTYRDRGDSYYGVEFERVLGEIPSLLKK